MEQPHQYDSQQIPTGFALSLGMNSPAFQHFSALDSTAKKQITDRARQVKSKDEMDKIVDDLGKGIY